MPKFANPNPTPTPDISFSLYYGNVRYVPDTDVTSNQNNRFSQTKKAISDARKLLVDTFVVVVFITIAIFIGYRVYTDRSDIVIESISVPRSLANIGLSDEASTHRLWDAIQALYKNADSMKPGLPSIPQSRQISVKIPDTGFSANSLIQAIRHLLGKDNFRVSGELFCSQIECNLNNAHLRIRVLQTNEPSVVFDVSTKHGMGSAFHAAAFRIVNELDPYIAARYLYIAEEQPEQAKRIAMREIRLLSDESAWHHNLLGLIHYDSGEYDKAIAQFEIALKTPTFEAAAVNIGNVKQKLDELNDAISWFRRALEFNSRSLSARINLANTLSLRDGIGDSMESMFHYNLVIDMKPNDVDAYVNRGVALALAGSISGAIESFEMALELAPEDALARRNLGYALMAYGRLDESIRIFESLYSEDENKKERDIKIISGLGRAYELNGQYELAIKSLTEAQSLSNEFNPSIQLYLGVSLMKNGNHEQAIKHFERVEMAMTSNSVYYYSWGKSLSKIGQIHLAIQKFTQAISLDSNNVAARIELGKIYIMNNQYELSIEQFRKATEHETENINARIHLGVALLSIGKYEDAVGQFEIASELDPTNMDTRRFLRAAVSFFKLQEQRRGQ